jgi:heme/copper-type cytochrome/quinol oxidase subunit 3
MVLDGWGAAAQHQPAAAGLPIHWTDEGHAMSRFTSPGPLRVIDVSKLPANAMDWKSPVWWGNTLMILIETTTVALLVASYFYLARNYPEFPPPRGDRTPVIYHAVPDLPMGTANLVLIVAACIPMYLTNQAARKDRGRAVLVGLGMMLLLGVIAIILRCKEFPAVHFRWNDNAYGSIVWAILGMHLTYLIAGTAEFLIMGLWVLTHKLDDKHSLDVTLAGGYWYWVAGTQAVIYCVIYLAPRMI